MGTAFPRERISLLNGEDTTRPVVPRQRNMPWRCAETGAELPRKYACPGYYQYWVLLDSGSAITTFGRVSKLLPGSGEVQYALALVTRRVGHWDQGVSYFEQALALDPRNVELLTSQHGLMYASTIPSRAEAL